MSGNFTGQGQGQASDPTGVRHAAEEAARGITEPWQGARAATRNLTSALPEVSFLGDVKHFMQRHPYVATGAVLALGYFVLGRYLPIAGGLFGTGPGRNA